MDRWALSSVVGSWKVWAGPICRVLAVSALGASLLPVSGCGGFFQCENKTACPSGGDGGTTPTTGSGDYAYVSYTTAAGASVVTGYDIGKGALTAINTVTLPFVPIAMAVNAANSRLYVASVPGATTPGIYEYAISSSNGSLTVANQGVALVTDLVGAMTTSPDGNYLYTAQSTGQTMTQYSVDTGTGVLTSTGTLILPSLSCGLSATTPVLRTCSIAVGPTAGYVVASLGTQGDAVFGYSSSAGITDTGRYTQISASTNSGDFSAALDASNNLYVAQTATMTAYSLASSGITNRGSLSFASGSIPRSVVVDNASKYVYTANVGLSSISGFAIGSTTALTILSNAPYAAPANVAALGIDSTNGYLVAAGYDASAGVTLYSVATTGVLTAVKSAATSTAKQYPVLVAMSH